MPKSVLLLKKNNVQNHTVLTLVGQCEAANSLALFMELAMMFCRRRNLADQDDGTLYVFERLSIVYISIVYAFVGIFNMQSVKQQFDQSAHIIVDSNVSC